MRLYLSFERLVIISNSPSVDGGGRVFTICMATICICSNCLLSVGLWRNALNVNQI